MRNHLAKYGVEVELSKCLMELLQSDNEVVCTLAGYKDGQQTGPLEEIAAKYVVGADGAKG